MKKVIWKFPLQDKGVQKIKMPKGAQLLSVQTQQGVPCLWALVDPEQDKEERVIKIFGTGHTHDAGEFGNTKFIGTYQQHGGGFIGHVFINI